MKFEASTLSKQYNYTKKNFKFGTFYLCEKFIIAELNFGIHLSWNKIQEIIDVIISHYGENCKIVYISNKINSYSFEPNLWNKFFNNYDFVVASASICYTDINYINATLEKQFSKKSVKRSDSLQDAISWALSLKELKD